MEFRQKHKILFWILLPGALLINQASLAQTESSSDAGFQKNVFFLSGDITFGFLASGITYERNLLSADSQFIRFFNMGVGYGRWIAASAGGSNYTFTIHSISGLSRHHFEASAGLRLYFDKMDYEYELRHNNDAEKRDYLLYIPQLGLGYRYQEPGEMLVFRVCIGIPILQCSIGFAF